MPKDERAKRRLHTGICKGILRAREDARRGKFNSRILFNESAHNVQCFTLKADRRHVKTSGRIVQSQKIRRNERKSEVSSLFAGMCRPFTKELGNMSSRTGNTSVSLYPHGKANGMCSNEIHALVHMLVSMSIVKTQVANVCIRQPDGTLFHPEMISTNSVSSAMTTLHMIVGDAQRDKKGKMIQMKKGLCIRKDLLHALPPGCVARPGFNAVHYPYQELFKDENQQEVVIKITFTLFPNGPKITIAGASAPSWVVTRAINELFTPENNDIMFGEDWRERAIELECMVTRGL